MTTANEQARRDAEADTVIERCAYGAAALALIPIPLTDTVGVPAVHVGMVVLLGRLHGVELTKEGAASLVARIGAVAGASYLGTRLVMGLAKAIVPVLPGLLGAPVVFASTIALGAVAHRLLAGDAPEPSDEEIRSIYASTLQGAKARFDPRRAASPTARAAADDLAGAPAPADPVAAASAAGPGAGGDDRLARLRRLRDQGVLAADEFDAAVRQLGAEGEGPSPS